MDKKEKTEAVKTEEKAGKCCCCDKGCDCGCQEGKECSCCSCGCCCRCCNKMIVKILCVLVIFLAGMGFHALLQCGFRCPMSKPRPMPIQMAPVPALPFPAYSDAQGGNVIIINTGDAQNVDKFVGGCKCGKDCGCNKGSNCKKMKHKDKDKDKDKDKFKHHHKDMRMMPVESAPMPVPSVADGADVK